MELLRRCCEAPIQQDGVRRSRCVIVRNTLKQLKTTSLVTIQQLLRPITTYKVSDDTIQIRLDGVESDWIMLPLDTPENIQRLLSLELTWAWVSEFREIDLDVVQSVLSRCGRYPSRAMLEQKDYDYMYGVVCESNSFSEDSPWYNQLEVELPNNWGYFVQPGAFEEGAENLENLPPRYYEDLEDSNTPEWCEQYIENRITPSLSGQAVFRKLFDTEFHVAKELLTPYHGYPLIIGLDTGRNPAAVIGQMDNVGRLLVFRSVHRENMGMQQFLTTVLTPVLSESLFIGHPAYLVLDPAGRQRSQIGEESVLAACKRLGFQAILAQTNAIDPRLRAVEKFLNEQRAGGAAVLFDKVGCHSLILAMQSKYRYRIRKDKSLEEKPDKTHPWSDLCDALQYLCLGTATNLRGRMMRPTNEEAPRSNVTAQGWT